MEYTFDNITEIIDTGSIKGQVCLVEEKPLPILQNLFDEMKKEYIRARNVHTEIFIEDYGEEEGEQLMNERYPKPINIDELANQAKIIANKYEICGTTLRGRCPGFIVKIPNVRVRVRTYCNLGDYYCWIEKFGIDKFTLKIYQAMPNEEGYLIFGTSTYPHPHIAGPSPCLGGFESPIKVAAGHFNMVGVLSNIRKYLNSYYGRSVYVRHTEFRPLRVITLPIELLKKYNSCNLIWDEYCNNLFIDNPSLKPEYNSDEYIKIKDKWMLEYYTNRESIELKPHECSFYSNVFNISRTNPSYPKDVQKIRLIEHKFDISYFQAYSLLINHGLSITTLPLKWGSKFKEYENSWLEIKKFCIDYQDAEYRLGFGNGLRINPDESIDNLGLSSQARKLLDLVHPRPDEGVYKLQNMPCNKFWKYIDSFKDVEEFLIPQDDYDERKDEAISMIDDLYPKLMEYRDAFSRKIIITLDKQKRRFQNGLKHTIPASTSNQLSFETLSQD
jgi:hypothetical protein